MIDAGAGDAQLAADLRTALRRWRSPALGDSSLATHLDAVKLRLAADPHLSRALALQASIQAALEHLRSSGHAQQADLLEQYYICGRTAYDLCQEYHLSERSIYYRLSEAVAALARALRRLERTASLAESPAGLPPPAEAEQGLIRNLPPPSYTRLFGVEAFVAQILEHLEAGDEHWLICLEGLGGLGKTAVAREAVGRAASAGLFAGIAWLTAKREFYTWRGLEASESPALTFEQLLDGIGDQLGGAHWGPLPLATKKERARALLSAQPYLVVLDNLETAADCAALPGQVWELANPSKFLLTSRHHVAPAGAGRPNVSSLPLRELSESGSLALLRYEGQLRGLPQVAEAGDQDLRPILAMTGGHPLALKLVAGQLASLSPGQILARLQTSGRRIDPFYRFLYWPSWELLGDSGRRLLRTMALLPVTGGGLQDLSAASGLDGPDLAAAIEELIDHSLLQAGGLAEKTYSIHRLTHHFVLSQVMTPNLLADGALRIGEHYLAYARQHQDDWEVLRCRQDHILQAMQICAGLVQEPSTPDQDDAVPAVRRILVECAKVLGPYMLRRGSPAAWQPYLEVAMQAARELGDGASQAELQNQMGLLKTRQGDRDAALALLRQAAEISRQLGDHLNLARSLRFQGNIHYDRNEISTALACYEDALDLLADADQPRELSHVYNNIGTVHLKRLDWERALRHFQQAVDVLDPERDQRYIRIWRTNIALLRWDRGEWRKAIQDLLDLLPRHKAAGDRSSLSNSHHYLCLAYTDLEVWEAALFHGRQALALRQALGGEEGLADLSTDLAVTYSRLGDHETAGAFIAEAWQLWQRLDDRGGMARVWLVRGDLAERSDKWPQAKTAYQEAVALLGPASHPPRRLAAMVGLARAYLRCGKATAAQAWLPRIEAVVEEVGSPHARVQLSWLQAEVAPPSARQHLEEALALCDIQKNDRSAWLRRQTEMRLAALGGEREAGGPASNPAF